MKKEEKNTQLRTLAEELGPLTSEIKWGGISKKYLGMSGSWMYNKLLGRDGNGGKGGFSPEEVERVRTALLEFSEHVREVAESL